MRKVLIWFTALLLIKKSFSSLCTPLSLCFCNPNITCKLVSHSRCNYATSLCERCFRNSDCFQVSNLPSLVTCNSTGICNTCLGDCKSPDIFMNMSQKFSKPEELVLMFSKPINLTDKELPLVLSLELSLTDIKTVTYKFGKIDNSTYAIIFPKTLDIYPSQDLVVNLKIKASVMQQAFPFHAIFSDNSKDKNHSGNLVGMVVIIIGMTVGIISLLIKRTNKSYFSSFIAISQMHFYQLCYGVDYPISIFSSMKNFGIGRVKWIPNPFDENFLETYDLRWNFENAGLSSSIISSHGGEIIILCSLALCAGICLLINKKINSSFMKKLARNSKFLFFLVLPWGVITFYFEIVMTLLLHIISVNPTDGEGIVVMIVSNSLFFLFSALPFLLVKTSHESKIFSFIQKQFRKQKVHKVAIPLFLIKQLLVVILINISYEHSIIQLSLIGSLSFLYGGYLILIKPFKQKSLNIVYMVSEIVLFCNTMIFLCGIEIQQYRELEKTMILSSLAVGLSYTAICVAITMICWDIKKGLFYKNKTRIYSISNKKTA